MIEINGIGAHLDFIMSADLDNAAIISFYDRSQSIVKSIGASLNSSKATFHVGAKRFSVNSSYDIIFAPIVTGKDKFYHAIAISKSINDYIMICRNGDQANSFYDYLMHKFNLPLMREWAQELYSWCENHYYITWNDDLRMIKGTNSISSDFTLGYDKVRLNELRVYVINMKEEILENCIRELFVKKRIWISKKPQRKLSFTNMDTYFKVYGKTLVENLEKTIEPLTELNGNVDDLVMKHMRFFPQQGAQVNGVLKLLNVSKYAILNEGMGTGKTGQGAGICEGYFVHKYLKSHPGKTLRDAYLEEGVIKYRNIIMCPGHLVSKWAEHIKDEIPYARVAILSDFKQLVEIRKRGIERTGREFYVISKDFAKLSYQSKPTPKYRRYGNIMKKVCEDCGREIFTTGSSCTYCNSKKIKIIKSGYKETGMICPHCKNILIPYKTAKRNLSDDQFTLPLDFNDFQNQTESNSRCFYCETELWQPHVANLGLNTKKNTWYRATHYANKAHKNTKTVWVHKDYADMYFSLIGEVPLNEIDSDLHRGSRKVSPGSFIKKQLKGYFDFAIFDEAHLYKSGSSAQANCMSSIISASKKQLALTGTIAGGMASHLFYLLYRLDPVRMQAAGYKWTDEVKFCEKYGVLETKFESREGEEDAEYNSSSKGRQKGSPAQKPGISPLIFMDFLLDKTVFLDLSDMSRYLPPLKEIVDLVDVPRDIETSAGVIENPEYAMLHEYNSIIRCLKELSRQKDGGKGILSTMLQFSLSYLDKPFGRSAIKSPKTGAVLVSPGDYSIFSQPDILLSKEKRLIEIVSKELKEGRNCVIYAEYTGSPETCVSYRLKELLERYCNLEGKIEVLESSYPSAAQREEWMHKKAEAGCKVIITNPRDVETGLDFCFIRNGIVYNYPTLIYYQMGYSLFTIWQSSRRHFRLNQREECRTYYLAIRGTVQQAVISLIAEKMAATSAIQGKFSAEGLTAMANGIDAKVRLAQALSEMDDSTGSDLQSMFDVINQEDFDDSQYKNYRPMLTLSELLGDDIPVEKTVEEMPSIKDVMGMFDIFNDFLSDFTSRYDDVNIDACTDVQNDIPHLPKAKKKIAAVAGQMSLF